MSNTSTFGRKLGVTTAVLAALALSACGHNSRSANFGGGDAGGIPSDDGKDPGDGSSGGSGSGGGTGGNTGGGGSGSGGGSGGGSGSGGGTAGNLQDGLGRVTVGDKTLVGQGTANGKGALGVSVLAPTQNTGKLATVGVLSDGKLATVDVPVPATGGQAGGNQSLLNVKAGGQTLVGSSNPAVVGVGVLSPNTTTGKAATVNLLPNAGGTAGGDTNTGGVTGLVGGVVGKVTAPLKKKGN